MLKRDISAIQIRELEPLVAMLTFHIAVLPREQHEVLTGLAGVTFSVLEWTLYESEDGFCRSPLHAALMTVLSEVLNRMPASYFNGIDRSHLFPGPFTPVGREECSVVIDLTSPGEHSTGCYLPPGVVGCCHFPPDVVSGLSVQVGSHSESLLEAPGPWKRWPLASTTFDVVSPDLDIAWMLGGIVYIVNRAPLGELPVRLTNVSQHGVFREGKWSAPYDIAPFCEIYTQFAALTVPSAFVPQIDMDGFCARFDDLIGRVVDFTGTDRRSAFRLVFDIQLPAHETVFGDPIFLEYEHFAAVVVDDAPSPPLLSVLMFMGTMCFPPDMFSEDDQACLGLVAACLAFRKRWSNAAVLNQATSLSHDFQAFWDAIARLKDTTVVTRAIRKLRVSRPKTPVEVWNEFLDELAASTGVEFTVFKRKAEDQALVSLPE
jgi:hypothetical protein